ncbi:FAD:protein FMN transferase [Pseudorhodobacter sp.]|uniref:FAD:protein FMN transferase n=1 Tax=Pseudorhodobacter sp. TaxID=1934400 RepID=UPI002647A35D|nr:FAD:protein FMN transferase [Pseudorhodobacter sp.]MDN5787043.1 FAD:protein FMN transferase [Pseudorhodobacter sp.]
MTTRRRFLAISAAALTLPRATQAAPLYTWKGVALGAGATIRLAHPDAAEIAARAAAEISRLEDVFSLYRTDSALSRLNANGRLDAPPFELLQCLSLAGAVHSATDGRFDPTIQPLWAAYAEALGQAPAPKLLAKALAQTGWEKIRLDEMVITMEPGMALTLNGIAQGFIADQVADLLRSEGLRNILIDTGEFAALGGQPDGGAWPVKLATGGTVALENRALASSAPLGTTFDSAGTLSHILDPRSGLPAVARWRGVSISARSAALADALTTAACLASDKAEIVGFVQAFAGAKLESAERSAT